MPVDPDKRKLRELKRAIKKRGNKTRRAQLKRDLTENPDEAAHSEEDFGRFSSANYNGLDSDSTRRRDEE
ncbi:MAG: hypothetical protein ACRC8S_09700 [Fimbriiglobus sp.]